MISVLLYHTINVRSEHKSDIFSMLMANTKITSFLDIFADTLCLLGRNSKNRRHQGRFDRNRTSWYRPIMVQTYYGTEPLWYIGNSQVIKSEFRNWEVLIYSKYIQNHNAT